MIIKTMPIMPMQPKSRFNAMANLAAALEFAASFKNAVIEAVL